MKHLRIVAWAFALVLATTAHADAGPIAAAVAAIATSVSATLAAGGVAAMLLKAGFALALNLGVSLLQRAMAGNQEQQQPGIQGSVAVGGDNPLAFIMGTYVTAGQLEYAGTWGESGKTPNAYLTMPISVSDLPVTGLRWERLWVNGEKVDVDTADTSYGNWGFPVKKFETDGGNNHFWVKFHTGTQTVADTLLRDKFGSDPDRPWGSDQIGRGVAYAIVTAQFNRELFTGLPRCRFEVDGIPLYDPRKDSSVGGSGSHRFNNWSTWEFSDNPIVMIYNIMRGIRYEGEWVYGLQKLSANRLPLSNWFAAMNACEPSAGNEGFRAGLEVRCDVEPFTVIEELLKACNGRMAEIGGVYKVHVGAPAAPVYSFTDEDIVVTQGQTYEPFHGLESTHNGIHASYPEPEEAWESKDAPARYNDDWEAADDGRRLVAGVSFPAVPYSGQVQRLMQSLINDERRFRRHVITLPPEAWLLEPNDTIAWTSARNGYVNKEFLIVAIDGQPGFNQIVSLLEIDPSDYDWDSDIDALPISVGFLGEVSPPSQLMTGWQVEPYTVPGSDGQPRRPGIQVFYDGDQVDVRAVRIQVREDFGAGNIVFDGEAPYGEVESGLKSQILSGMWTLPNEDYEVQGQFIPYSRRKTTPSEWLPVKTPNVLLGGNDVYFDVDVEDIQNAVQEATEWLREPIRYSIAQHRETVEQIFADARHTIDIDFDRYEVAEKEARELSATYDRVTSEYTEEIAVVAGELGGVATRTQTLEVAMDGYLGAGAVANAFSQQLALIEANENGITIVSGRLDTTEAALSGYLGANAVANTFSSQLSKIEANEDGIDILASDITQVQASLSGYLGSNAVANAFSAQLAQIVANENSISAVATSVTQVEASLDGVKKWTYTASTPGGGAKLRNRDGSTPLESGGSGHTGRVYTIEARRVTGGGQGSLVAWVRKPSDSDPWEVEIVSQTGGTGSRPEVFLDGSGDPAIRDTSGNTITLEVTIEKSSINNNTARANALGVLALDARVTDTEGDVTAIASALLAVEATVDGVSAGGGFKAEVGASPGSGWSNVGLYARAGASATGAFEEAAIFLQARSSGSPRSRVIALADQFVIASGSNLEHPFVFQSGVLTMNATRVNEITAGILRSVDNRFRIDLNNRRIVMSD